MIRIVLENILLFALPTAAYLAYVYFTRKDGATATPQELMADAPMLWLAVAGVAAIALGMALLSTHEGGRPADGYKPPVMKDGVVVPGQQQ